MFLDTFLNSITMYRLTLYYLIALLVLAAIFSFLGLLPYNALDIALDALLALAASWVANIGFAKIFHATTNYESVFITALIIACLIPVAFPQNALFLVAACIAAMGSKYLLTIEKQHVFNPAAVGVLAISLLSPEHVAIWWIGNPIIMPFVVIGGLLLVRRIRKEKMVYSFFAIYAAVIIVAALVRSASMQTFMSALDVVLFKSPGWFLGFVMLTEPLTAPARKRPQYVYAVLVALLTATAQMRSVLVSFTPEEALCIGNIAAYMMSPRKRLLLALHEKVELTRDTIQFIFRPLEPLVFKPGQYMEWTLPHPKMDSRGNRRHFSLLSAPKAEELAIAVKFYDKPSSYKQSLKALEVGQEIIAANLGGDFTLPRGFEKKKLAFIAGGIGITPFISMIEHIIAEQKQCDITMLYSLKTMQDAAFVSIIEKAREFGVSTVYTISDTSSVPKDWEWGVGVIDDVMIQKEVPDYAERMWFISGPQLMVQAFEKKLGDMAIPKRNIMTDYFPGFAG
jgi:ferredoxin-NADP reductase/Na+-translocating ferredoxin:NAD+ oxidoreductase RnfD subunit